MNSLKECSLFELDLKKRQCIEGGLVIFNPSYAVRAARFVQAVYSGAYSAGYDGAQGSCGCN